MSTVSSSKLQAMFWLLAMALLSAVMGEVICPEGSTVANRPEPCIGVEIGLEGVTKTTKSRRLLRGPQSPLQRGAFIAPSLANRRSLLQWECSDTDDSSGAIWSCTNAVRRDPGAFEYRCGNGWVSQYQGLGPLSYSKTLEIAAQKQSQDQADRGSIGHTGNDGSSVSDRARRAGYPLGSVTENVAYGYVSARDVVLGWMCSPGHRRSIMSCDTINIGVGVAAGGGGRKYHTQVFGCPAGASCTCAGDPDNASSSPPSSQASQGPSVGQDSPASTPTTVSLPSGSGSPLLGGPSPSTTTFTPIGSSNTPPSFTPIGSSSTPTSFTPSRPGSSPLSFTPVGSSSTPTTFTPVGSSGSPTTFTPVGSSGTPTTFTPVGSSGSPTTFTPVGSSGTPTTFTPSGSEPVYYYIVPASSGSSQGRVYYPASGGFPFGR